MSTSAYTLLIVESPVIADVIQQTAPSSVYVLATGGFCWQPVFDIKTNKLKSVADPQKKELRKEMKSQASVASGVVIATDHDPSGDFIAWSISQFLKQSGIKRGSLQSVSKQGVLNTLENASPMDDSTLELKLKNRFLIHHLWSHQNHLPAMADAGLATIFGSTKIFSSFLDQQEILFKSTQPVACSPDEWISVSLRHNSTYHNNTAPLSLFDLLPEVQFKLNSQSYSNAQLTVRQLFETRPFYHQQSLISYPRTNANAFYSETWRTFSDQYMKLGSLSELKPTFLQQIADSDTPHESIHPLNLDATPEAVMGELSRQVGDVYELIYTKTLSAIRMPDKLNESWENDFYPETGFYPAGYHSKSPKPEALRPVISISDLGKSGHNLGITKPSSFGADLDSWIDSNRIQIKKRIVEPGKAIAPLLSEAKRFKKIFTQLLKISDQENLSPETVREVFTS